MIIAVVGKNGQVAHALIAAAARRGLALSSAGRPETDLADPASLERFLTRIAPSLVINAAAYTAVDKAETDQEAAFSINAVGPEILARLTAARGIPLVHISTDYVFDGTKPAPYVESDPIHPLSVYGASKAAGEAGVRDSNPSHLILRTSWVYSAQGANFVKTMLRLGATRDEIGVVADQTGCPTYAPDIAEIILSLAPRLAEDGVDIPWGTYHLTGRGPTTWHDFAAEIFRLAAAKGLKTPRLKAITTADYPTPATRPQNSVLDNSKIENAFEVSRRDWRASLSDCIGLLAATA